MTFFNISVNITHNKKYGAQRYLSVSINSAGVLRDFAFRRVYRSTILANVNRKKNIT